jgi:dipeptidyl aminopeptidase/acylaminoacyl peptidase
MRKFSPSDVGSLTRIGTVAVDPSGQALAFTVIRGDAEANAYRSTIWVADTTTGTDGAPSARQVTPDAFDESSPTWSPDGSRLAFVRTVRAGARTSWELRVADGTRVAGSVVLVSRHEAIQGIRWSPDGRWLLFVSRDSVEEPAARPARKIESLDHKLDNVGTLVGRPRQLWATSADGYGAVVRLTHGPAESYDGTFSPTGAHLAFVSGRHADADLDRVNDLWLMPFEPWGRGDPEPVRLTATDGILSLPSFNPEGTAIAFYRRPGPSRARPGHHHAQIAVIDLETKEVSLRSGSVDRNLTSYAGTKSPTWVGDAVLTLAEDRGDVPLLSLSGDGGVTRLVDGARTLTAYDITADGRVLAYVSDDLQYESEVFLRRGDRDVQVTSLQGPGEQLPSRQYTVASEDGCQLDTWLLLPPGATFAAAPASLPLLLMIHGGPATQYGNEWLDEFQLMAGAGFAVLFCNPHGASGQSEQFARSVMSPLSEQRGTGWGGIDFRDVMAVLDATLSRFPFLDSKRVGVMGGSYGGYLTSWIVSHTNRFAAACSERAANDLLSMDGTSDTAGRAHLNHGVHPFEHADELRRMSPLSYVKDIETPLLIVHSDDDLRCPAEQADKLFAALRQLGRTVEYWRFPGEGHELSRSGTPRHRVQRAEIITEWFTRWLSPATPR